MKRIGRILLLTLLLISAAAITGCAEQTPTQPAEPEKVSFEGQTLNLYVAAGMKKPMDEIITGFQEETGAAVAANFGSSGELFAQIKVDQPCDLYYSADWSYIDQLDEADKLEEGNKFLQDNIVLITSESGKSKVSKVADLGDAGVTVVIADPQAPAGIYAKNALENLGIWEQVSPNIKALPTTVNQVLIMVKEDQVDAGLVYSSVANGNEMEPVEVIDEQYERGDYMLVRPLLRGGNTELAKAFARYAQENVAVFEKYGYKAYE